MFAGLTNYYYDATIPVDFDPRYLSTSIDYSFVSFGNVTLPEYGRQACHEAIVPDASACFEARVVRAALAWHICAGW
jgi:hypothetical protein